MIHCLGLDWRLWRDVIPELSEQYRLIAYDLHGHGYASNSPKIESIQQLVDDLVRLMDELNLKSARIAGHSLGGRVAQQMALRHPERVTSLALVCTMARTARQAMQSRADEAERQGMTSQVAPSLLRWLTPEVVAENPWYVRYARARVIRSLAPNWAAAWRALAQFDVLEELQAISVPTNVIAAEKDLTASPEEYMRPIADRIPGAKLSLIPGAPHLAPLVKPHEVATLLAH
ncbi:MAG: alpha/beta fold hydrolase [Acidobacteriota bacterium]|nr:alpha/beta fold hydrolase [Acidobacteriota bacterium]